jgi:hypothetical protein
MLSFKMVGEGLKMELQPRIWREFEARQLPKDGESEEGIDFEGGQLGDEMTAARAFLLSWCRGLCL